MCMVAFGIGNVSVWQHNVHNVMICIALYRRNVVLWNTVMVQQDKVAWCIVMVKWSGIMLSAVGYR